MNLPRHPLGDYIQLLQKRDLLSAPANAPLTREVALVSCDSRDVVPGTLFLCKGAHFQVSYLQAAKEKGAFAYLAETPYPQVDLPCIQVSDVRLSMALLADAFYDHPSGKLGVVGITGTKGKSSTGSSPPSTPSTARNALNHTSPPRSLWTWSGTLPTPWTAGCST